MTGHVLVVGSVNVDYLLPVARLPDPGETVTGGELVRAPGGKGGNAAAAASRLGARTTLVAAVGRDDDGDRSVTDLAAEGVEVEAIERVDAATGTALVLTDSRDENAIVIAPGANGRLRPESARSGIRRLAGAGTVLLVNFEVPGEVVEAVAEEALALELARVIDPAPGRAIGAATVAAATMIVPNEHELGLLGYDSPDDLLATGANSVAVTLGAAGVRLHRGGAGPLEFPAHPVAVRDTVGAGDAFAAGVCVGLAEGLDVVGAVQLGSAAGALATTAAGARGASLDRAAVQGLQ